MKRALFLYHAWNNHAALVGTILDEHHIAYDTIDIEKEPVSDLSEYAAVPAKSDHQNLYERARYPYFIQEEEQIRLLVEKDIPYLGICLGGQLLADALGVQPRQHTLTEIGFGNVQFTHEGKHDPLFAGLPGWQRVFNWHEDTFDLPSGAIRLATNDATENQAFRYGQRAYGLQYHIELDEHAFDNWLHHPSTKGQLLSELGEDGYTALEKAYLREFELYQEHTRILMNNFLRISNLL